MTIAGPLLYVIATAAAIFGYRSNGWVKIGLFAVAGICLFCAVTGSTIFVPSPKIPQIHTSPTP